MSYIYILASFILTIYSSLLAMERSLPAIEQPQMERISKDQPLDITNSPLREAYAQKLESIAFAISVEDPEKFYSALFAQKKLEVEEAITAGSLKKVKIFYGHLLMTFKERIMIDIVKNESVSDRKTSLENIHEISKWAANIVVPLLKASKQKLPASFINKFEEMERLFNEMINIAACELVKYEAAFYIQSIIMPIAVVAALAWTIFIIVHTHSSVLVGISQAWPLYATVIIFTAATILRVVCTRSIWGRLRPDAQDIYEFIQKERLHLVKAMAPIRGVADESQRVRITGHPNLSFHDYGSTHNSSYQAV